MFETIRNAWKIADLRQKIIYTVMILVVVRLGSAIPVPFLDASALQELLGGGDGNLLGYINILSGGAFSQATLFALSVSPYITSSIVMQLLTIAIPYLERLSKEGEDGKKRLNKITRYVTVALALLNAFGYYWIVRSQNALQYTEGWEGYFTAAIIILAFTAGAMMIVWLGEQIDTNGIGNGISLILFGGIVSRAPSALLMLWSMIEQGLAGQPQYLIYVPLVIIIFGAMIVFIIWMTNAERRIPIQYAKRVVGRKMYGGQSSFIPIKVNMSGVLPVIFASSFLGIPGIIKGFVDPYETTTLGWVLGWFDYNTWIYAVLYFVLIIAFNYFYVAIQYNPIEMANNLRKNNGAIPGIRPGKPTSDFISKVISKITLVGAFFLAVIAIFPILLGAVMQVPLSLGGTSIIILVGVALDTMRTLESQMMMRHYKGFLE